MKRFIKTENFGGGGHSGLSVCISDLQKNKKCYTGDMTYHFKKQLHAFTLSEVLITLGIIGVVAAMTMPSLITKIQNARLESQFKHSYSLLNNALQAMKYEHNIDNLYTYYVEPNNHDLNSNTSSFSEDFNKVFKNIQKCYSMKSYIAANKYCKDIIDADEMTSFYLKFDGQDVASFHYNFFDIYYSPSGAIFFVDAAPSYSLCIYIDTNGPSLPNRLGYDFFPFHIDENGVLKPGGYMYGESNVHGATVNDIISHAISNTCYQGNGKSYFSCLK